MKILRSAALIFLVTGYAIPSFANIAIDPLEVATSETQISPDAFDRNECIFYNNAGTQLHTFLGECKNRFVGNGMNRSLLVDAQIYKRTIALKISMKNGTVVTFGPIVEEREAREQRGYDGSFPHQNDDFASTFDQVLKSGKTIYYNQYGFYYRNVANFSDIHSLEFTIVRVPVAQSNLDPARLEFRRD